jgi:hypothetical protein
MTFAERGNERCDLSAVRRSGKFFCKSDELIGHATLCRNNHRQFITGVMVFFKDVNNAPDTLRIGNGSPAKFHQKSHFGSLWLYHLFM